MNLVHLNNSFANKEENKNKSTADVKYKVQFEN
jgi:hypothetical protein